MAATMIGGAFLSATVQTLVEKLASTEFLDYITNTKLNVSLLRELKTTLLTLQPVMDDAEEKQINNPIVKQWLDDLKDAVFDAEDLLNQISYDSLRCKVENAQVGNKTNQRWNFLSSPLKNFYRDRQSNNGLINSQMKTMCETLQRFALDKVTLGLQTKSARASSRTPSSSVVNESAMVGRKDEKETIMNMLLSQRDTTSNNIGVVAILGMGGLGKTTLAQLLYNDKEVQQYFDMKAWVCVSEDFDTMRVTKSLLESITSRTWDSTNLDLLRVELKKNSREKRFLFVLDDMWNENYNDWDELVSPFIDGKPGSRVIITTRQQKVAEVAHTFPIQKLEPLSNDECWSLLSKHALGNDEFHDSKTTTLEEIGRKIAKKCGGLPIAAKTLGGLLRSKVDANEWTSILNSNTMILSSCTDLVELPVHMGNLINLRHLDITNTDIKELPVEIARLDNLQTLTVFVVGKRHVGLSIKELRKFTNLQGKLTILFVVGKRHVGLSIKELRKFTNLRGKLTIKDLHNVIDAREAEDANLKSKEKIEKLELLWGKQSEDSQKVKAVFAMLQPAINLKSLNIGLAATFSQRPRNTWYEDIGDNWPEFYCAQGGECSNSSFQPFLSLERIKFDSMPSWKEWLPFEGINFAFPQLRTMEFLNCPELRGHLPSHLPCIEEIVIKGCAHLLETPSTLHWLSSIKKININRLAGMTQLSLLESDSPCTMQDVVIEKCAMLLSVPNLILRSTCLQHLKLHSLSSLTAFPSSGLPTSLQSLHIEKCENLSFLPPETWSNYTSLVSLELWSSCDALTSFPLDGFPALQTLYIYECKSLDSIYIIESPSHLQSLHIICLGSFKVKLKMDTLTALTYLGLDCEGELSFSEGVCLPPKLQSMYLHSRVKTMPPVTEWGLQGLTALSSLEIGGCDDIVNTLMKESLLPISLVNLTIINYEMGFDGSGRCEGELSFCEGVCLPPKLQSIDLNSRRIRTTTTVTEWGLHGLTALSSLRIGNNDDIVNTLMKESLLPISLVDLCISYQCKMKSFDVSGLRHLSSLKSLWFRDCEELESLSENCLLPSSLKSLQFWYCKKLESIPEDNLPDSLEILEIYDCPLLEERYKRKENWSKIAHIPVIDINGQVTMW
ncbi:hypothetical protein TSUD_119840 [Trifolium subterraneum]|uniref:Rx N-terminal domain-containing protein n=1 Tax=Trifolium subterraneum TaxID=3900 RepID=A0A2Z6N233_TRISU|nr:hypothetical protein TSUD_119840 [Trifolium subterraneum]